ncbi:hypothetical protein [Kineothrix sedimenti]|uniref:ABC transmembrane type-1 domain-containing protein n=1 Tax=Kineothrix sedimenti TaxID=3123317 RepID=A0ABZ3EWS4_9FIRM
MRILKKVLLFPVRLVLMFINLLLDLFMRVESLVAGIGGLFLLACLIYSLINLIWIHVGILFGIIVVGVVFVLLTAEIKVAIEILLEKMA